MGERARGRAALRVAGAITAGLVVWVGGSPSFAQPAPSPAPLPSPDQQPSTAPPPSPGVQAPPGGEPGATPSGPPEAELRDRIDPEEGPRRRPPPRDEVFVVEPTPPPGPPPCPTCADDDDPYEDLEAGWLELHAHGGWASLDGYELSSAPSEDAPDPLVDRRLELDGDGPTIGGGLRFGYTTDDGVRFGAGFGGYVIDDLRLRTEPLPGGVVATIDEVVAIRGELALGKAFDVGPVWPYVDAVVSVTAISASLRLDTPQHGFVGETTYLVPSATVAPRIGAFVPLSDAVFLDVAAQYGLFGAERGAVLVGLGVWDD